MCASIASAAFPADQAGHWTEPDKDGETRVHLYFYWSETCPHCLDAHPFIETIPLQRPWVVLHMLEVSKNRENIQHFEAMAKALGQVVEGVPALFFCNRQVVGWDDTKASGSQLLADLDACRAGQTANAPVASKMLQLPLLGTLDPATISLPLFTVIIAGLDAFNPCAFFVLLFLLSLLAHQKSRRSMLLIGSLFVATSGVMYFAFMAAWLNVFQLLGALSWITLTAGVLAIVVGTLNIKDFFVSEKRLSLSIPKSAKPGIYRRARAILQSGSPTAMVAATIVLAVAANFYELLCTAGFPMVFTRILTLTVEATSSRYGWLALYNLIYVTPMFLIVLAFVGTLSAHKLSEREGRLLKLLSGTMMFELGLLLTFMPTWLNNPVVIAALLVVALLVTIIALRLTAQRSKPQ